MREILFRGKCVNGDEWVYGDYKSPDFYGMVQIFEGIRGYAVLPETIGQFTGILDKHDNAIFDGDIVRVITPKGEVGLAKIGIGAVGAKCRPHIGVYGEINGVRADMIANKSEHYEVIGNIHDNPELLTDKT